MNHSTENKTNRGIHFHSLKHNLHFSLSYTKKYPAILFCIYNKNTTLFCSLSLVATNFYISSKHERRTIPFLYYDLFTYHYLLPPATYNNHNAQDHTTDMCLRCICFSSNKFYGKIHGRRSAY